jgi:DNA repair and recombination protein RAD52
VQAPLPVNFTAFTEKQIQELNETLSSAAVKQRQQSGRNLSYIEGWWVIREANRIFGFGAWDQEIVEIKCVSERERKIGRDKKDGWGVSYVARVRITVADIEREGVGAGHGIDVDLGLAHESAVKEAATDAMKRAFMTFGNQFGLALYDKDQSSVEDKPLSTESVSTEADKVNETFINRLMDKMQECGIDSNGIKTLKHILNVQEFDQVREPIRDKLIANLTAAYAEKLNAGQNSKGEQVVEIITKKLEESTASLQEAASAAFD